MMQLRVSLVGWGYPMMQWRVSWGGYHMMQWRVSCWGGLSHDAIESEFGGMGLSHDAMEG